MKMTASKVDLRVDTESWTVNWKANVPVVALVSNIPCTDVPVCDMVKKLGAPTNAKVITFSAFKGAQVMGAKVKNT
jgi:hypothetical protein